MNRLRELWIRRFVRPLVDQLRQGSSPSDLAKSVAWGFAFSLFPVLGTTTLLCAIAGHVLRLNHVVMQSVNYLAYPLQVVLIIPFLKVGDWIYSVTHMSYSISMMTKLFEQSPSGFFEIYGRAILRACSAWALFVPLVAFLLALIVRGPITHLSQRIRAD